MRKGINLFGARIAAKRALSTTSTQQESVAECNVCIVGGGMVGTATAMHLAQAGVDGVRVVCGRASGVPSSSDDASRLIGTGGAADDASVRQFGALEARSGARFWHDCGLLEVSPSKRGDAASLPRGDGTARELLRERGVRQQHLDLGAFFDARGFDTVYTERGRGWLDPRALTRAARGAAEAAGAEWHDGRVDSVEPDPRGGGFVVSTRERGAVARARCVVLALGAFAPLLGGDDERGARPPLGAAVPLETLMWGKTLYHARLSERSAEQLAGMPPLLVHPADGAVPAPAVSYEGAKAGMYFYIFPPVRYADGFAYLKIGHSPYDPIIAALGTDGGGDGGGGAPAAPPTAEQIGAWFAGVKADASTAVGRDVVACVADSERFFAGVLRTLLADCEFDGGHMTTCVTAKSSTGGRLLGEIAPRRPHPPDGVQRSGRSRQPRVGRGDRRPGPGGPRAVVGVLTLRTSSCSFSSGVRQGGRGSGDRGEREKEERGRKRRKEEAEKEERGRKRGRKSGGERGTTHTTHTTPKHTTHTTPKHTTHTTQHTQHTQHQNTHNPQHNTHNTHNTKTHTQTKGSKNRAWESNPESPDP